MGKRSKSKKNSRSLEVTATEDAGVGTPTMHKQQTRLEGKQEDQELQSEVDDWEPNAESDNSDENDQLDTVSEDLMMLEQSGIVPFEDVEDITAYVVKKLAEKVSQADLANRIRSRALRNFLHQICAK